MLASGHPDGHKPVNTAATNQLQAGQKQQPLHTLGGRSQTAPCQRAAWPWASEAGMLSQQCRPHTGESQQCQNASCCPFSPWARGKVPCSSGVTGSRTLWLAALCPCSQHNAAVPAEPRLSRGHEPSGLLCFLHVQLLQAGCRAQGLPPATAPPHQPAPDRVPWMHSVLERVKSELGVPSKARHGPSFAVCPVVPQG